MTERFYAKNEAILPVQKGEFLAIVAYHKKAGLLLVKEGMNNHRFQVQSGDMKNITETIDEKDNVLVQAARRAIVEEVGKEFLQNFAYYPGHYWKNGPIHTVLMEYVGDPDDIGQFHPDDHAEIEGYQWFKINHLKNLVAVFNEKRYGQLLRWVYPALIKVNLGALFW